MIDGNVGNAIPAVGTVGISNSSYRCFLDGSLVQIQSFSSQRLIPR